MNTKKEHLVIRLIDSREYLTAEREYSESMDDVIMDLRKNASPRQPKIKDDRKTG